MARRYFSHMAPATIHDAMYFFHATASQVKEWLSLLPVSSAQCQEKTYFYIEIGQTYDHGIPKCTFLSGFDQLMLAYEKKESLYLKAEHLRSIFNLAGIVMPALMLDGRIIGKWKKKNKKLWITLFEKVGSSQKKVITDYADTLWNDISSIDFAE